ncbi:hypothetical protein [Clostridium sp. Marseille-P2415]|nr:hypothetical protein [Clostridium sp. Marseille-P2415]
MDFGRDLEGKGTVAGGAAVVVSAGELLRPEGYKKHGTGKLRSNF